MQPIDWVLVIIPLAAVFGVAIYTNRYVNSVADFLSAGRCAGRYLLANAKGESESGVTNTMSRFEPVLVSGFVLLLWDKINYPVALLVAISGFVIYRYRETRALTLAQFFEIRYSRGFRLFMGIMAFVAGILNYGIFPAVSARFFIYFLDLPLSVHLGPVVVSTFALIMAGYLACTVLLVLCGGLATMMITCSIEGLFSQLIYVIIAVSVFYIVSWHHIVDVMSVADPGKSLIDPFDAGQVKDFNFWFVMMSIFNRFYTTMAFQHKQGFNSAARTAHESRMGGLLGEWRGYARTLMITLLALCALTYLKHPAFAQHGAQINEAIHSIKDTYLQSQMTVPIALRFLMPAGIKGLFVSMMVMGLLSGDGGHLHSWGSIFIQDIVMPLRGEEKPLSPKQHIWMIRMAVTGVAVFAFCFSTFMPQTQAIMLWMFVTGAVFTGGAGAAIIGGLYWRKGTAIGAWAGTITGSSLALIGILCGHFWPFMTRTLQPMFTPMGLNLPGKFFFNDQVSGFIASSTAACTYIVVSLLTCRQAFDLDRMLHRGKYAIGGEQPAPMPLRERFRIKNLLKFDDNFTFRDKIIAGGIFWYSLALAVVCVIVVIWNTSVHPWSVQAWTTYWLVVAIIVPGIIAVITLFWFTIGGVIDIRDFFIALKSLKRDVRDDGRVVGHHNLADESSPGVSPSGIAPTSEPRSAAPAAGRS